ncbi:elongator complex protein 3 [Maridesulfovibrio salexigens]|uniref:Radical SAM domain protein n=1 Tax=Maridesulfovibrio salexigens (strain ATCC 14822 / DSM 2638 / NCIMB 8403 / VKM B-1763) TaxID=526222 RepID=C6BU74_MARSD|nr:radical SAM protein [Maridesulfovibrio salexigens]ACS81783.1 Radical SAM domain protein [Maridesulfovibrio salexigens DSM 2638]
MSTTFFKHPEPPHKKTRIWPVFMPFMGCPTKCIYCSQDRQTGTGAKTLSEIYQDIEHEIPTFFAQGNRKPLELAFFGGTFTALPFEWQQRFILLAAKFKQKGFLTKVRCSTRPDCIESDQILKLRESGLDMIELGIQSFSAEVLRRSARNYSPETAINACRTIRESGLSLGIQLLPGLPGTKRGDFQRDISQTIGLKPDAVRIYPCLTVKGTGLEKLYLAGKYTPWSLSRTEEELAPALLRLWQHKIHVIRIGVAHEEGFEDNIVAGPVHPALGQKIRSKALYLFLSSQLAMHGSEPKQLVVPQQYSGELWGHKGNLKPIYAKLGITPDNTKFLVCNLFEIVLK